MIHSTARFEPHEISEIKAFGDPGWLVEGMIDHDTFSARGHQAFPGLPFFAPPGLAQRLDFEIKSLDAPPPEWGSELEVIHLEGAPAMDEYVFFHHPSGTLIVCDLLFHFPEFSSWWAKGLLQLGLGKDPAPGFSKRLKKAIENKQAFRNSLRKIMKLPIQRVLPGHGVVLDRQAKARAEMKFKAEDLL